MQVFSTPPAIAFRRPWPGTRRGFKLWFLSIILGIKGVGYLIGSTSATTDSALRVLTDNGIIDVPLRVAGGGIVTLCAVAAFCSYCHYGRDRYGYNILAGFTLGWVGCFLVAPLLGAPLSALQGALSYLLIGAFILYSANDPEPNDTTLGEELDDRTEAAR